MTQSQNQNTLRASVRTHWLSGAYLAAAKAAIIAMPDEPELVTMIVDQAVGYLMGERFDCFREMADEAIRGLLVNAEVAEAQADAN